MQVRSLGWEGHGNPLQYSCLENLMDKGAWWARVHGVVKSRTQLIHSTIIIDHLLCDKQRSKCYRYISK